jgi:hypothetical protein
MCLCLHSYGSFNSESTEGISLKLDIGGGRGGKSTPKFVRRIVVSPINQNGMLKFDIT